MKIETIKKEMLKYRDFYGGELLGISEIEKSKSKKELEQIFESHRNHIEAMLSDAYSHLDSFKKKLGLDNFKYENELQ